MNLRWWTDRESVGAKGLLGFMVSYGGDRGLAVFGRRGGSVVKVWRGCGGACVRVCVRSKR